jgi:hypothetical protein
VLTFYLARDKPGIRESREEGRGERRERAHAEG